MKLSVQVAAGLCLCAIIFSHDNPPVYATMNQSDLVNGVLSVALVELPDPIERPAPKLSEPSKPLEYVVNHGDSLSKIAEAHATTWERLYAKNLAIENPDIIKFGEKIIIPLPDEVLALRAVPVVTVAAPQIARPAAQTVARNTTASSPVRASSNGNTYGYGYCTYYAKQRRPDLPNSLGNANTWVARAAAQGIGTGFAPRAGAIGQQGNHVVYVESVNGDGTITVSEMNYIGRGVVSSRTVSAGNFQYIY